MDWSPTGLMLLRGGQTRSGTSEPQGFPGAQALAKRAVFLPVGPRGDMDVRGRVAAFPHGIQTACDVIQGRHPVAFPDEGNAQRRKRVVRPFAGCQVPDGKPEPAVGCHVGRPEMSRLGAHVRRAHVLQELAAPRVGKETDACGTAGARGGHGPQGGKFANGATDNHRRNQGGAGKFALGPGMSRGSAKCLDDRGSAPAAQEGEDGIVRKHTHCNKFGTIRRSTLSVGHKTAGWAYERLKSHRARRQARSLNMALARARIAARKTKDRWKSKQWYKLTAPPAFNGAVLAETLSDEAEKLQNRTVEVTLNELTGDMKQMHIKVNFQVREVVDTQAKTVYVGHSMTSDYTRRMVRRGNSKIPAVFDVTTQDGSRVRVKPFAVTDRRCQTGQNQEIRKAMGRVLEEAASKNTLGAFLADMLVGELTNRMFKETRKVYPVRRVEIAKSEMIEASSLVDETPTIKMSEPTMDAGDEVEEVPGDVKADGEEE